MMERLRDRADLAGLAGLAGLADPADPADPALAELTRLVRAVGQLDPSPGAQERVRRALAEGGRARRRRWTPVLVAVVLLVALPVAIAGVHRLVAPPRPAPPPVVRVASAPAAPAPGSPHRALSSGALALPAPGPAPADDDAIPAIAQPEVPLRPVEPPGDRGAVLPPVATAPSLPRPAPGSVAPAQAAVVGATPQPAPRPETATAIVPASPVQPVLASEPRPGRPGAAAPARGTGAPAPRPPGALAPRLTIEPAARPEPPRGVPDAALVLDAMRRLRRGRDAAGALRELDDYLARFPDGDLAEEALALAIEARTALGDRTARALAAQYLQRYPHGRFRDPAERVLQLPDH